MTRKEQKEAKRKMILFSALELFVKRGYYDTKITDIAEAVSMSTGLLFHYFESKEALLVELVKMGAEGTRVTGKYDANEPEQFFEKFLEDLFVYARKEPWIFNMFVLMGQVRRAGMPREAREIALSLNQIETSAKLIELGQKKGVFREGDARLLSRCFWTTVQGIMEEMAFDETMQAPDPKWITAILRQ
ncbi:MAG: TetR/AcrR family transcriptional regulator [bacterium]|nr:TetR/AcrR family transcriptional regulator [bacterium]